MKTPKFWNNKNLISALLWPLGKIYAGVSAWKIKHTTPIAVNKPVICIGNLTAGGTGKTPVAISMARMLQDSGYNPFFVSRGYGGKLSNVIVDIKNHSAKDVGDEPLLLSMQAPVSINSDRPSAAQKAIDNGADVIIMDDGFQNPGLQKDISFLVFDGGFGVGNSYPIPAGPLREDIHKGLMRADAIIIIGKDQTGLAQRLKSLTIFQGYIEVVNPDPKNKKIIAFAGIGRPQKFYNSLKEIGYEVLETKDFADHHFYTAAELSLLINRAKELGADIYTTSKDMTKIPFEMQKYFHVLEIKIKWEDEKSLKNFITTRIV